MLIEAALDRVKGDYIVKPSYLDKSIEILKGYIGSEDKQDLQLESIFAIQLLSTELEHPSGKHRSKVNHQTKRSIPEYGTKCWEKKTIETNKFVFCLFFSQAFYVKYLVDYTTKK